MDQGIAAVVLAAGDGLRMKSQQPKVCCEVLLKPMLSWVVDACLKTGVSPCDLCVVVSDNPGKIPALLPEGAQTAVQAERRGTGHAVRQASAFLREAQKRGATDAAVLCGDAPFMDAQTLAGALAFHRAGGYAVTVLTAELEHPGRYGRIVRQNGRFCRIVEAADATADQLAIREVNSGSYWFSIGDLLSLLPLLDDQNAQGEFYLTDLVELAGADGRLAGAFVCPDRRAALGANDPQALSQLNRIAREAVLERLRDEGVNIPIDDGVIISPDAQIGCGTTILPGCILSGQVLIGEGCTIGPNTRLIDCEIGNGCTVESSRVEQSRIGNDVRIGPFAQIRPGCAIADRVKIGNFVEIKNSTLGEKTSAAHLTYIGDSDFGAFVNIGCGVVTVNYDGRGKYRTVVEDHAFIGCNTNLIAPVRVGAGAYVAAATTVTEDVDPGALAIGRVRQIQKPGWAGRRK
jgi:bifunctional UDP-N-acetylglucosamine pyrophosphorylase/glucosamine-1-phosphate N-acetyltransferase